MIPIWIELQCTQRGARMVNFATVSDFYTSKGRSSPDLTYIVTVTGHEIIVRDSYEYISDTLQKRTRQIRNLISSMAPEQNAG